MTFQALQTALRAADLPTVQALLAQDRLRAEENRYHEDEDWGDLLQDDALAQGLPLFRAVIHHPVTIPTPPPADADPATLKAFKDALLPWRTLIGTAALLGRTDHLVAILTDRPELATPNHLALALWKTTYVPGSDFDAGNDLDRRQITLTALLELGVQAPQGNKALELALTSSPDQSALMPWLFRMANPLAVARQLEADYLIQMDKGKGSLDQVIWESTGKIAAGKRLRGLERLALLVADDQLDALRQACIQCPLPGLEARLQARHRAQVLVSRPAAHRSSRPRPRA